MLALDVVLSLVVLAAPAPSPRVHNVPRTQSRRLTDVRDWRLYWGASSYKVAFKSDGTFTMKNAESPYRDAYDGLWSYCPGRRLIYMREKSDTGTSYYFYAISIDSWQCADQIEGCETMKFGGFTARLVPFR